jgi:(hydroxyamino)benzene mutase
MSIDDRSRRLLWHGILLFLLGLVTGFAIPFLANPRMGLSAHLQGVLNGMFLVVAGLAWDRLALTGAGGRIAFWSLLYGTYANWGATTLAAVWGTGTMTPLAAPGMEGQGWQERIVNLCLVSLSVSMVVACTYMLVALGRGGRSGAMGAAAAGRVTT